ncbi:flagellar motor switch protein FliG [Ramlibacter sp.]|uniref:flagellar motor switch protein FliG n=1 Tax=Ramlibacter sp. TaxID=1917967 RepID=UPI003D14D987
MATATSTPAADAGIEAGAILLLALGEDCAAQVLKHLSPREVERLGERMAGLTSVGDEQFDDVLARFSGAVDSQRSLVGDTGAYVSNVLKLALGDDKAGMLLERIVHEREPTGIESLRWMDAETIADIVRAEHPQIVATVLVHLERDQAGRVLASLDESVRHDVVLRIATLETIDPNALKELDEVLARAMAGGARTRKTALGGAKAAAEILNVMGGGSEAGVLEAVREADADLATKIEEQMFTFADLLKLDNKGMQRLLRDVGGEQLVVALKGAEPEMREHVFANMSSRAAETLREDLESRGPVRLSEVEAQQKEVLKVARRLADEGELTIAGGGDADFV